MIHNLRIRFVFFNVLIISVILSILALTIFLGSRNEVSLHRLIMIVILSLILVFIGSLTISKFAIAPISRSWQKQLDFTADASHELRTPLAVIRTNLEIVLDSPKETVESQLKWLENIETEHLRMTRLVEDLLTLSRSDAGEQGIQKVEFVLDEVLEQVIHKFQSVCEQKSIRLISDEIEHQIPLLGDPKRIEQLLVILLDNACQYTPKGGQVRVTLQRREKRVVCTISDTGIGIGEQDLNKIFDRFYRVTESRKRNPDGSGLGLAIAKWIVEQHHGRIRISSILGEGSSFIIELPYE